MLLSNHIAGTLKSYTQIMFDINLQVIVAIQELFSADYKEHGSNSCRGRRIDFRIKYLTDYEESKQYVIYESIFFI